MRKKNRGAYYTPNHVSRFILKFLKANGHLKDGLSILEPSVGDGAFLTSIAEILDDANIENCSITIVEKIKRELEKATLKVSHKNYGIKAIHDDFLNFQRNAKKKYDLVVGNPPYIKKGLLNDRQIQLCSNIHASENLSSNRIKNIWTSFLVKGIQMLNSMGTIALILPSELLQVKYTNELRRLLKSKFHRLEIFTFKRLLFNSIGQDTIILFGYKNPDLQAGIFFAEIENENELESLNFELKENHALSITETKWTHHILSSDEIEFLYKIKAKFRTIGSYCESKPGIVTAANNFFIVNSETESAYKLKKYTNPIIQKGLFVNGSVVFGNKSLKQLISSGKPSKLINLNSYNKMDLPAKVQEYLDAGLDRNIHTRYKCRRRKKWFHVPNIPSPAEGFFFKRCDTYPKVLKNMANVLVTDSAYEIRMKPGYDINSFVYSFYNSLTLTFAELAGRYYGGGVLEITPSEFKELPLPYFETDVNSFRNFTIAFENKTSIDSVADDFNERVLKGIMQMDNDSIARLRSLREKLLQKRTVMKTEQ